MRNNEVTDGKSSIFGTGTVKSPFPASHVGFSVPNAVPKPNLKLEHVLEQPVGVWIYQHPELMDLAWTLYLLALEYKFRWAAFWPDRWNDWSWVKMAMEQTFNQLNSEDKSGIREFYEAFIQKVEYYDEITEL